MTGASQGQRGCLGPLETLAAAQVQVAWASEALLGSLWWDRGGNLVLVGLVVRWARGARLVCQGRPLQRGTKAILEPEDVTERRD